MKSLVVFDVDGTLTPIKSSWNYIHTVLNTKHRSKHYMNLFFNGLITYEEWVVLDLSLWRGLSYSTFRKILYSIPWRNSIERLVSMVKKYRERAKFIAITGGFTELCERVIRELGFDWCIGTEVDIDEHGRLTGFAKKYVDFNGKARTLQEYIEMSNEGFDLIVSIGDSLNDLELFEESSISIAFCCDEDIGKHADIYVKSCDLEKLVEILNAVLRRSMP